MSNESAGNVLERKQMKVAAELDVYADRQVSMKRGHKDADGRLDLAATNGNLVGDSVHFHTGRIVAIVCQNHLGCRGATVKAAFRSM